MDAEPVPVHASTSTVERALAVTGFEWCDMLTWAPCEDGSLRLFVDGDCVGAGAVEFGDEHIDLFEATLAETRKATGDPYPMWVPDLFAARMTGLPLTRSFAATATLEPVSGRGLGNEAMWADLFARPVPDPERSIPAPPASDMETITRALRATAGTTSMFWRRESTPESPVEIYATCSDLFVWGCADAEMITGDNVDILESVVVEARAALGHELAANEAGWALQLFAARVRGMRPQGAVYANMPPDPFWAAAFDASGPERRTGPGNPKPPRRSSPEPEAA